MSLYVHSEMGSQWGSKITHQALEWLFFIDVYNFYASLVVE